MAPRRYSFEIFFKDLKGPNNATDADFRAALAASEDQPATRQRDQPFFIAEFGTRPTRGGRATYYYLNGIFKLCLIETGGDPQRVDHIMESLGFHHLETGAEVAIKFKSSSPNNELKEILWESSLSDKTYFQWFKMVHRQIDLSKEIREKKKEEQRLEAERQEKEKQRHGLEEDWQQLEEELRAAVKQEMM